MDSSEFRRCAKEMVDYVADYLDTIRDRPVLPDVQPGFMRHLIPDSAPEKPEDWKDILHDVERVIMPGVSKSILLFNNQDLDMNLFSD